MRVWFRDYTTLFVLFSSAEQILLSDLTHLVIDEADTLFDHSFVDATTSIIRHVNVCLPPSLPFFCSLSYLLTIMNHTGPH